ncbi:DUF2971 domain-containing protein [Luteococcus sp. Sow4_B9]|uniref:DUF2971 domain-containing protein n=1 Tax=Luteococcus sp. Sow4_B9 TaxID=3438792 RepID=UPI003F95048D
MSDRTNDLVWHYTDISGLLGIVEKRELWAGHCDFMNDPGEGRFLLAALGAFLHRQGDSLPFDVSLVDQLFSIYEGENWVGRDTNVNGMLQFVACASGDGNCLTLWRNYGKSRRAVAIGMDPKSPLGVLSEKPLVETAKVLEWDAVEYISDNSIPWGLQDDITAALDKYESDEGGFYRDFGNAYEVARAHYKHSAFEDEREERIVVFPNSRDAIKFRSGPFGVTPYVRLTGASRWGEVVSEPSPLPIKEIRLGPGASPKEINSIHLLLEQNGFGYNVHSEEVEYDDGRIETVVYAMEAPPVAVTIPNIPYRS